MKIGIICVDRFLKVKTLFNEFVNIIVIYVLNVVSRVI